MQDEVFDYMIKTVGYDGTSYNKFKYPLKTGALVEAPRWDPRPVCGGGIHGLVHWTQGHYIENKTLWLVLKFIRSEAVVIGNDKIKVPRAWVVCWGSAAFCQERFAELTGKEYQYKYAVQFGCSNSVQTGGSRSTQTAGWYSTQNAGRKSTQTAGVYSTQSAGDGSVSIIHGEYGYCQHIGRVLQVMVVWDGDRGHYEFPLIVIDGDGTRHALRAVKVQGKWKIEIRKEVENE